MSGDWLCLSPMGVPCPGNWLLFPHGAHRLLCAGGEGCREPAGGLVVGRRHAGAVHILLQVVAGRRGAASLLVAEFLNKRCASLDEFLDGRIMSCGCRSRLIRNNNRYKVLVLDDSVFNGTAMGKVRERLAPVASQYHIIYGTVFAEGRDAKFGRSYHFWR